MASVTITQLTKRYGSNIVVDAIDLDIAEGEFMTFLGPSGCGKTTTLRCIAGLERPDGGSIRIGDREVVGPGTFVQPDKRGLGMVFQSYALWPHMSVVGNVSYPLKRTKTPRSEQRSRALLALQSVGLEHLADRSVGTLSGGQQQRVALARAIVAEPPLILFDEPLSNLDTKLRATMRDELRTIRARLGTTSIYVTHDQTEALTLSDRIVVLDQGHIQQIGTPEEIYSAPENLFVAGFLGFENLLEGVVTQAHGDACTVRFGDAGSLHLRSRSSVQTGDRVVLAARASDFTAHSPRTGGSTDRDAGLRGRVLSRVFLGDQTEITADLGEQRVALRLPSSSPALGAMREGSELELALADGTFSLFPSAA